MVGEEPNSRNSRTPDLWSGFFVLKERDALPNYAIHLPEIKKPRQMTRLHIVVGEEPNSRNSRTPDPLVRLFCSQRTRCATKLRYSPTRNKKASSMTRLHIVVGEEGFEPPTLWSQTRCATKLRYSPTYVYSDNYQKRKQCYRYNGVANET